MNTCFQCNTYLCAVCCVLVVYDSLHSQIRVFLVGLLLVRADPLSACIYNSRIMLHCSGRLMLLLLLVMMRSFTFMAGGNDGAQFGTSLSTPQAEAVASALAERLQLRLLYGSPLTMTIVSAAPDYFDLITS